MNSKINILGTEYTVEVKPYNEMGECCVGKCNFYSKRIVICSMYTVPGWANSTEEEVANAMKVNLRHEIVHAFLNESGLQDNSLDLEAPWARNEEMVDWIAVQAPKLFEAFKAVDCL